AAPVVKEAELRGTRTGQVLEDFQGVSVFQLNARRAAELAKQRPALQEKLGPAGLRKEVARLLGVRLPAPAAQVREAGAVAREQYRIRKLAYQTVPGVAVPGLLAEAPGARGALWVRGDGEGRAGGARDRLARAGRRVLALDRRGFGETAPAAPQKPPPFGVDYREAFMALHLGRPLLGQRVADLLAVVAHL